MPMHRYGAVPAWRLALLVTAGAMLAVLLVSPVPPGRSTPAEAIVGTTTRRCADLVVLGARASGQSLTTRDARMGTEVYLTVRDAVRRLESSRSVRLEGLPYPAVPTSRGTEEYGASVREGATMLRGRLVRLLRACRRTEVALAGFSQGAHVVHRTLARLTLPRAQARRVVAVALIADPAYNRRTTNRHQVRYGMRAPRRDGLIGPGPLLPAPFARRAIDFCHPEDLVCNFGGTDGKIWMARLAGAPHTAFHEQPATVATNGAWLARVIGAR